MVVKKSKSCIKLVMLKCECCTLQTERTNSHQCSCQGQMNDLSEFEIGSRSNTVGNKDKTAANNNNITVLSPIVRGGPKPKSYSTMTVNKYAINSPSKLTTYEDVSATCRHSYQNHPRETRKGGQNHLRETFF
ncbi:uncharacterized protein LOC142341004 isoform X1 [Convolutriloba macropyga]|uniref:uncharacterized protein LOC142341004 isoform X1 n=1 Tax=Convolutriloba macropyga TaxID=536237 RepID=UPI003F528225